MSSAAFHTASMSAQLVSCGEVLKAKRIRPRYVWSRWPPKPDIGGEVEQSTRCQSPNSLLECKGTLHLQRQGGGHFDRALSPSFSSARLCTYGSQRGRAPTAAGRASTPASVWPPGRTAGRSIRPRPVPTPGTRDRRRATAG